MTDLTKPDPVLQKAVKEIEAICEKYDIGGHITLASQTHGEYLMHFPKWSKAQMSSPSDGSRGIHFKSKKEDKEDVGATIHMIQVFQIQGIHVAKGMDKILEMLESKILIGGGPKRI